MKSIVDVVDFYKSGYDSCWQRRTKDGGAGGAEDSDTGGAGRHRMVIQVEQEGTGLWHR